MAPVNTAAGIVLTFIASSPSSFVTSFSFSPVATNHCRHVTSTSSWRSPIALRMSDEESADADSTATVDEGSEAPPLDPEVVALKESIASLESDLKAKKSQLASLKDMAEKYSSAGYARQVALVENNKRLRGANLNDSRGAARATVMQSFLPVLEELDAVGAKYEGNAFAKTFDAGLRSEFESSLAELGVSEYFAESGQALDAGRMVAVEEEYSEEFAAGTVIRALKSGLEISGNVVRPAEVVGSVGQEGEGEEGGEAAETSGEAE
eukprot:CAMPEP_0172543452 /NCGR_PEP_ID=MMETSP1067-20121228/13850_1 /TAXON_ID=265564 ORGANISM="Thalassiosira punctigera, Strain Tpunct2005C2" /NCGR_SAMPLE_ID=MMETSP1067 /ASSEMBLY_ACC=CAM_ASM_000444 /LENGTH=265 /DNA_ID=CAMNT_0013329875 /DNA_START=78 /DNA_END=875 /DNA_ORIENTATION=-